jgi:hypothetical protein
MRNLPIVRKVRIMVFYIWPQVLPGVFFLNFPVELILRLPIEPAQQMRANQHQIEKDKQEKVAQNPRS